MSKTHRHLAYVSLSHRVCVCVFHCLIATDSNCNLREHICGSPLPLFLILFTLSFLLFLSDAGFLIYINDKFDSISRLIEMSRLMS